MSLDILDFIALSEKILYDPFMLGICNEAILKNVGEFE